MLGLAVQPPAQARPRFTLYPPIVARLSSETSIYGELSQIWAVATLIGPSGEVLPQHLGGKFTDSAHPIDEGTHSSAQGAMKDRAYFYFPNLVIYAPGRYRVRITLMRKISSYETSPEGDVRHDEYVDSHSIVVEEGLPNQSRPSECRMRAK